MTGAARRIEVTVNDRVVSVWEWSRWRDAVTACDPVAGGRIATAGVVLRDELGAPLDPDGRVVPGARILVEAAGG